MTLSQYKGDRDSGILEIVLNVKLSGILAGSIMPDGWVLACKKTVCMVGRYVVGALIWNQKSDTYAILDEYGLVRVDYCYAYLFLESMPKTIAIA